VAGLQARYNKVLQKTAGCAMIISIMAAAWACGRDATMPPLSAVQRHPEDAPPVTSSDKEENRSPVTYQSRGRRDPFRPSRAVIAETPPTVDLALTGIVQGPHSLYAVVESEIPPRMGYIIRENDVVESAKVVKITKDRVVFEVRTKNSEGKLIARYVEKQLSAGRSK